MWISQNYQRMKIHTSVVMLVNNYANVMVILVILSVFNSDCQDLVETETKDRTVTEEQMVMLSSKLDYLKRALNQQFLNSAKKAMHLCLLHQSFFVDLETIKLSRLCNMAQVSFQSVMCTNMLTFGIPV